MKTDLRKALLLRRAALAPEQRRQQSRTICKRVEALPVFQRARLVAGYAPLPDEVDDRELLLAAAELRKRTALPRIEGRGLLFHQWRPGDPLVPGRFGIEEPEASAPSVEGREVELIIVPGVGFDRGGHRLGFGRGYYDRFLSQIPISGRVGVAFDIQLVDRLPKEAHDVQLGWIVTPSEILRFQEQD